MYINERSFFGPFADNQRPLLDKLFLRLPPTLPPSPPQTKISHHLLPSHTLTHNSTHFIPSPITPHLSAPTYQLITPPSSLAAANQLCEEAVVSGMEETWRVSKLTQH